MYINQPASRHMSAKLTDVLQLISSNYCIMKNYTIPVKLKLLEDFHIDGLWSVDK